MPDFGALSDLFGSFSDVLGLVTGFVGSVEVLNNGGGIIEWVDSASA